MKFFIVRMLEALCTILDWPPGWYWDRGVHFLRHGQVGCRIGFAQWAVQLDER